MKKTAYRYLPVMLVLAALTLTTGCNTVSIHSRQYLGGQTYAPSDPAQVQILQTNPTRPNVRLGEVEAVMSSESVKVEKIETAMRNAAAKLGANAVVIESDHSQITGAVLMGTRWNRTLSAVNSRVIIGVAIRYQ